MKTIEVNGEEYVLKADVDEELKNKKQKFRLVKPYGLTDPAHVIAMGTVELGNNGAKATRVNYDYLQHDIKIIKEIGCDYVTLAIVDENMPLIIGREIDDDNKLSGLIMAPMVKDED